jgi:hypothetical protein
MFIDKGKSATYELTPSSIKVSIRGRRKTVMFLMTFYLLLINGFCFLPIVCLAIITQVGKLLPVFYQGALIVIVAILYFYGIKYKSSEVLDYFLDQEDIEIDERAIKIKQKGFLGLNLKKEFRAEQIKGITSSFSMKNQTNFSIFSPITISNIDALLIWRRKGLLPYYHFGRGLSSSDAQNVLNTIYVKYPKYRYTGSS